MTLDQDEQLLYEAFANYASDSLFWSLIFLNNAVFGTPFLEDSRNKLMSLSQMYETIMLSVYPVGQCSGLIETMKRRSGCFCPLCGLPACRQSRNGGGPGAVAAERTEHCTDAQ